MGFSRRHSIISKKQVISPVQEPPSENISPDQDLPSENISPLTEEEIACVPLVLLEPFKNYVISETQTQPKVTKEGENVTIILNDLHPYEYKNGSVCNIEPVIRLQDVIQVPEMTPQQKRLVTKNSYLQTLLSQVRSKQVGQPKDILIANNFCGW